MGLTAYEQETVINFNREESTATIYTADPVWMRKLSTAQEENPSDFKLVNIQHMDGKIYSVTYECPKKFIRVAKKARQLSDEQKEALRERLRESRRHTDVLQQDTAL